MFQSATYLTITFFTIAFIFYLFKIHGKSLFEPQRSMSIMTYIAHGIYSVCKDAAFLAVLLAYLQQMWFGKFNPTTTVFLSKQYGKFHEKRTMKSEGQRISNWTGMIPIHVADRCSRLCDGTLVLGLCLRCGLLSKLWYHTLRANIESSFILLSSFLLGCWTTLMLLKETVIRRRYRREETRVWWS